jgi:IstB-like ATP binding protein
VRFDFEHVRGLKRELVAHPGTLDFVAGKENVVFLGPPGTGKIYLAASLRPQVSKTKQNHPGGQNSSVVDTSVTPSRRRRAVENRQRKDSMATADAAMLEPQRSTAK